MPVRRGLQTTESPVKTGLFTWPAKAGRTLLHLDYNVLGDRLVTLCYSFSMARRRRKSLNRVVRRSARRDVYTPVANRPRLPRYTARYIPMNDFRTFHPERALRPLLRPSGRTVVLSRPIVRSNNKGRFYRVPDPVRLYVTAPRSVLVCVRRRQRKEVLHAYRKTGTRGQARPRRSSRSEVICR